jgi:methyl-accepting chemotaxis protein
VAVAEKAGQMLTTMMPDIQQNSAAAEEMASTAEEFSRQADQLQALLTFFTVNEEFEQF